MTKEVIHVGLYGGKSIFGGRETPLEASIISCDKHESCSYFKNGHCLNVRGFGSGCKFGSARTVKGYTSRAKKYYSFKNEWRGHESYGKLTRPPLKLALVENVVIFPYSYIHIEEKESGELEIKNPSMGNSVYYIDEEKFTPDFIYKICIFKPQALMGGEIKAYQKETVPLFLAHLEEVFPEKYQEFVSKYKALSTKIDYVGRKAILKTIKPSLVYYKSDRYPQFNEEWEWDGTLLTYKSGYVHSFNITKDYEVEQIQLKPSDKSIIKITNNDQVTKDTIFVD